MKPNAYGNWKLYYKEFFGYLNFMITDEASSVYSKKGKLLKSIPERLSDIPESVILLAREHANTVCGHAFFDAK